MTEQNDQIRVIPINLPTPEQQANGWWLWEWHIVFAQAIDIQSIEKAIKSNINATLQFEFKHDGGGVYRLIVHSEDNSVVDWVLLPTFDVLRACYETNALTFEGDDMDTWLNHSFLKFFVRNESPTNHE